MRIIAKIDVWGQWRLRTFYVVPMAWHPASWLINALAGNMSVSLGRMLKYVMPIRLTNPGAAGTSRRHSVDGSQERADRRLPFSRGVPVSASGARGDQ